VNDYMCVRYACSNWDFGKILLLKLANIVVIYVIKERVTTTSEVACDELANPDCNCPLKAAGYQFFFLLLSDMTIGNIIELGTAFMRWRCKTCLDRFKKAGVGDFDRMV
jgi:hypothetical protein